MSIYGTFRIQNVNDGSYLQVDPTTGSVSSEFGSQPTQVWQGQKVIANRNVYFGLVNVSSQLWLAEGTSWASAVSQPIDGSTNLKLSLQFSNTFPNAVQFVAADYSSFQLAANSPQQPPTTRAWWQPVDPNSKTGNWYLVAIGDQGEERILHSAEFEREINELKVHESDL